MDLSKGFFSLGLFLELLVYFVTLKDKVGEGIKPAVLQNLFNLRAHV